MRIISLIKKTAVTALLLAEAMTAGAQTLGVKSSLTMLATLTPNAELTYRISDRVTLHLPVLYNPWVLRENSRLQQLTVQPGARYWTRHANVGYFASGAVLLSRFHMGGFLDHKYRYDGNCYGLGIGAGHAWMLSRRLNIEAEAMAGIVYAAYDKCGWEKNSRLYARERGMRIIPAKIDISLVYFIK